MAEIRNQKEVFEGSGRRGRRGPDRRSRWPRRKSDWLMMLVKYAAVAIAGALLFKYLG